MEDHSIRQQTFFDLPDDSLIRLSSIIQPGGPLPIGRSTWYAWRKAGKAPSCVRLGEGVAAYRVGDIKRMLQLQS